MQVALTVWEDRISPLFDAASKLLIVQIHDGRILTKHLEQFECSSILFCAARLDNLGISVLICGGISEFSEKLIEARGIRVLSFTSGVVEKVLEDYLAGCLGSCKQTSDKENNL
ncbi:MAG: NifB/NifX family molybdenum-iron cluster-binding protein [Desulfobacteraceae bacterium]|jgi:predicted Fe-Mo cluster-binding NifX family protein